MVLLVDVVLARTIKPPHLTFSFHSLQRTQIYQIAEIDTSSQPYLYRLRDLMGDLKTGHYYAKQLMLAPTPSKDFKAEVIIPTGNACSTYCVFSKITSTL